LKYKPEFNKVANVNLVCRSAHTGGERYCDFDAGAGTYVNGTGRVLIYGVEHWNDAVPGGYGVKVREFYPE
jgi:hypothetical protein